MKQIIIIVLVLIGWQALAVSPGKTNDRQLLAGLFDLFKKQDNYGFQVTIISTLDGNAKAKSDTIHMTTYQSKSDFVLYTQTENDLFFVNKAGQFRVNKKDKAVYYSLYGTEAESAQAMKTYANPQMEQLIDSFFLAKATDITRKQDKSQLSFHLKYPEQSMVSDMDVTYSTRDSIFKRMRYSLRRPSSDGVSTMKQQVVMDHYEHKMPAEVKMLISKSDDLRGYLLATYNGYSIKAI